MSRVTTQYSKCNFRVIRQLHLHFISIFCFLGSFASPFQKVGNRDCVFARYSLPVPFARPGLRHVLFFLDPLMNLMEAFKSWFRGRHYYITTASQSETLFLFIHLILFLHIW